VDPEPAAILRAARGQQPLATLDGGEGRSLVRAGVDGEAARRGGGLAAGAGRAKDDATHGARHQTADDEDGRHLGTAEARNAASDGYAECAQCSALPWGTLTGVPLGTA